MISYCAEWGRPTMLINGPGPAEEYAVRQKVKALRDGLEAEKRAVVVGRAKRLGLKKVSRCNLEELRLAILYRTFALDDSLSERQRRAVKREIEGAESAGRVT